MKTSDYKSFHYLENKQVMYSNFDTVISCNKLLPDSYRITYKFNREEIVIFQEGEGETPKDPIYFIYKEEIEKYINAFITPKTKERVNSKGFNLKGGILLYGKEGTGKTSITKYYYNQLIKKSNAIVFHIDQENALEQIWTFIQQIRGSQEGLFVIIFDEIDKYMHSSSGLIKSMLDGNLSIDNCFFIGITNYIDKIPDAIKDRPSRFKYCLEIEGIQEISIIENLISTLMEDILSKEEIKELSRSLQGETLDIIKHKCIDRIMEINQQKSSIIRKVGFNV